MDYGSTEIVIGIIHNILLFVAAYFAVVVAKRLFMMRHKKEIMAVKKTVFLLLSFGVVAMALVFLLENLGSLILQLAQSFYWAEFLYLGKALLYVVSYLSFAAAFAYFWYSTAKMHKLHIKEPVFIFGVVCGVFIWLYYLFVLSIMPGTEHMTLGSKVLTYFNPIIVSVIFILTLVVHPRMKANVIRTPLWYISSGIFTYFLAYMMYEYSWWNVTMDFLPVVYEALLLLSSFYFALGFFAAKKKFV